MDKKKAIGFLSCSCSENLVAVPKELWKLGVSSCWVPRTVFFTNNVVLAAGGSVHFHPYPVFAALAHLHSLPGSRVTNTTIH